MARYTKMTLKTVEEWLAVRQPRLGGSEISSVIGINPFQSRYELYQRKKGLIPPTEENMAMRLGHKLENAVAELLQEEAGYHIIKNTAGNLIYLSNIYPFAEASPDRIGYLPGEKHNDANRIIIEIKTTQKAINADEVPEHWITQVQWYMGILGINKAVIAWLSCGRDFGYREFNFNKAFFDSLIEAGREFMDCLNKDIEPDAYTAKDIDAKFPKHTEGKVIETNDQVALACMEYKKCKAQIKELEAQMDAQEELIKLAIQDGEALSFGGLTIATYKAGKDRESFDAKAFRAENPELAMTYMKTSPSGRRLVIK